MQCIIPRAHTSRNFRHYHIRECHILSPLSSTHTNRSVRYFYTALPQRASSTDPSTARAAFRPRAMQCSLVDTLHCALVHLCVLRVFTSLHLYIWCLHLSATNHISPSGT
eukprot:1086765-Rhodomonas_salina.4